VLARSPRGDHRWSQRGLLQSASWSAFLAVAGPGAADEPTNHDHRQGQQPELDHDPTALGTSAQLAVLGWAQAWCARPATAGRPWRGWPAPAGVAGSHGWRPVHGERLRQRAGRGDGRPGIQVAVAFGENRRETEQPRMNGHFERTPEPWFPGRLAAAHSSTILTSTSPIRSGIPPASLGTPCTTRTTTPDVAPLPSHLGVGLVDLPAVTDGVPTRPSGLGQQRREPQHPPVDRDVVDLDPAFGEELFDVAVGQAEAQVPADREDDDIRWEAEAGIGGPRSASRARATGSHTGSLAARTRSPRMQQCPSSSPAHFGAQPAAGAGTWRGGKCRSGAGRHDLNHGRHRLGRGVQADQPIAPTPTRYPDTKRQHPLGLWGAARRRRQQRRPRDSTGCPAGVTPVGRHSCGPRPGPAAGRPKPGLG
jgi:hypothetical protein